MHFSFLTQIFSLGGSPCACPFPRLNLLGLHISSPFIKIGGKRKGCRLEYVYRGDNMNRKMDLIIFAFNYSKLGIALTVLICLMLTTSSCNHLHNIIKHDNDDNPIENERPPAVDHSASKHFPPIGKQKIGDCTCWSSAYYYNTYTQARDEGLDASTGDPDVICSPRFLFSLISMGASGAECTEYAMKRLGHVGCAPVSLHPMSAHWTKWPGEEARIAALNNRPGSLHMVRADTAEGLETIKQHIAKGGCAVTRALFTSNYPNYGASASGPGIDNAVMYSKEGSEWLRHSLCICGYDDERSYVDHRNGKTYRGAFLISNSEGPDWGSHNSTGTGTKGFLWVAYNMFLEGKFGLYDHDTNPYKDPCYDNPNRPMVYYYDDRPKYRSKLYAVVGVNHSKRNLLTLTGGIGPVGSPEFIGPKAIEETHKGEIQITDTNRVVVDLNDGVRLFVSGRSYPVFVELKLSSKANTNASITSADFFLDPEGDGSYEEYFYSGPAVTIAPGTKGHVVVDVLIP